MTETSRDVVDNLLRGKKAGRVGLVDSPWTDTIAAWVEQGYPTRMMVKEVGEEYWRRADGRWVDVEVAGEYEEPVPAWEHFGYDLAGVGPWFDVMPWRDYDELVDETGEWDVRRNGAGAVLKYWKHKSGTPEHLIVEAGFDALNPMERKAKDNDPFAFAEAYGDRLAFVGGLDARVFETNDKDIIRREVADYIEGMKARGARLVFASDHSISPNTRYDTYCYALQVYREHMLY